MKNTLSLKCPCCGGEIIADSRTGEVLSHEQKAKQKESRSMGDLIKNMKGKEQEIRDRFELEKEAQKNRKNVLDEVFKKSLEKVDKDAPPPKNPFDL